MFWRSVTHGPSGVRQAQQLAGQSVRDEDTREQGRSCEVAYRYGMVEASDSKSIRDTD